MQGLSAGRVQSVATRLVVERERERMRVRRRRVLGHRRRRSIRARSTRGSPAVDGTPRRAGPRLRPRRRRCSTADAVQLDEDDARGLAARARGRRRSRSARSSEKPYTRRPARAVHDLDAAAGGEPQAALLGAADDARRPAPVRERLHHLHAHRLDDAVGVGARRGARPGARAVRRGGRSRPSRASTTARSRTRRRRTRRSVPPATASARPTRCAASSRADEFTLYDLIWKRTVASQMADARGETVSVRIGAHGEPTAATAEFAHRRHRDHVPRLPARLRGGPRRAGRPTTRSGACRSSPRATALDGVARSSRTATRPRRRRATPRRRS